ncbi:MAG: DUF1289 domain-containing protein [Ramlibacter sp.]
MSALELLAERAVEVAQSGPDAEVPSPCLSVCRMDPNSELCAGCFRTLDEIAAWSRMPDDGKRRVWRLIAQRALASEGAMEQDP